MRKKERKQKAAAAAEASKKQGGVAKIREISSWAYAKVPVFPFLDRPASAILIFSVSIYLIFTAYVFLFSPKPEFVLEVDEGPLVQNAALGIADGEEYAYVVGSGDGRKLTIVSLVEKGSGCSGFYVTEIAGKEEAAPLCVSADGTVGGQGSMGSQLVLFSPWMLAVSDNFTVTVKATASAAGVVMSQETLFRSKGKVEKLGRDAYEIEVIGNGAATPVMVAYVDAQKRILLYAKAKNSTISLVKAPFPLSGAGN